MVQLHGEEGPSFCAEVGRRTGAKVIKAIRVPSAADVQAAEAFRTDFHLFDAHRRGAPGGTGESFDWELPPAAARRCRLILAGGLRPENVAEAIEVVQPVRGRRRQRRRGRARGQGPRELLDGVLRGGSAERGSPDRSLTSGDVPRRSRSASGPTGAASCPRP